MWLWLCQGAVRRYCRQGEQLYGLPESHGTRPMSGLLRGGISQDFVFFEGFDLLELLSAIAWRMSALKADPSIFSPS